MPFLGVAPYRVAFVSSHGVWRRIIGNSFKKGVATLTPRGTTRRPRAVIWQRQEKVQVPVAALPVLDASPTR